MSLLRPVLMRLATGDILTEAEAEQVFGQIMSGDASDAEIAGLLMALRVRGETVGELTGAVRAIRARMLPVAAPPGTVDVCGTGGDGLGTLNISTAVTFVLAGSGVPVAKHGNRALSSRAGAADVLTALGVDVEIPPARLPAILRRAGCAFLFAPSHHPALRHAAAARVALGTRTILNLAAPLANPAGVKRQLVGVFDPRWAPAMAETLEALGAEACWIVHGQGLDELTLAGENLVTEVRAGARRGFVVSPEQAGLPRAPLSAIKGGDAEENAASLLALLRGARGAYRDTVLLNAAAALMVADRAGSLREGVADAARALDAGAALAALEALRRETASASAEPRLLEFP